MRNSIFIIVLLLTAIGCNKDNTITGPGATPYQSRSKDGILYTFSVAKDNLGIFDTLKMSLTAFNITVVPETLSFGYSPSDFNWSLTNGNGITISYGPRVVPDIISTVVLTPNHSEVIYYYGPTMAEIFRTPIKAGFYLLHGNLGNGLSFQINLQCGKSDNEINDPTGINSPIYPMKVGNSWTYKINFILDGSVIGSDTLTQTIVGEKLIAGEKWFLMNDNLLITERPTGIYIYYPDIKTAVLKYKYPAIMGEHFVSGYSEFLGDSDTLIAFNMSVDSVNQTVSVPDGNFICTKYHAPQVIVKYGSFSNNVSPEDAFISNIGVVKKVFYSLNSIQDEYWELISTNVQK